MIIKRVPCKWASILAPDEKFTPRWKIDIYPGEEDVKKLEKLGVVMKEDDDEELYVTMTKNVSKKKGGLNTPVKVVGPDKAPWPENKLVGNGSIVSVIFDVLEVDNFGKPMQKPYLNKVQIIEHVEYGEDFDDETEGGDDEDF